MAIAAGNGLATSPLQRTAVQQASVNRRAMATFLEERCPPLISTNNAWQIGFMSANSLCE